MISIEIRVHNRIQLYTLSVWSSLCCLLISTSLGLLFMHALEYLFIDAPQSLLSVFVVPSVAC